MTEFCMVTLMWPGSSVFLGVSPATVQWGCGPSQRLSASAELFVNTGYR